MKVYNVVVYWEEDMGLVSVYSYSSLEKAVKEAVKMLRATVIEQGGVLWDGAKNVSLSELSSILFDTRFYVNEHYSCHAEKFWIRIDSTTVDG